jgi:hypothetical protein
MTEAAGCSACIPKCAIVHGRKYIRGYSGYNLLVDGGQCPHCILHIYIAIRDENSKIGINIGGSHLSWRREPFDAITRIVIARFGINAEMVAKIAQQ